MMSLLYLFDFAMILENYIRFKNHFVHIFTIPSLKISLSNLCLFSFLTNDLTISKFCLNLIQS